MIPQSDRTPDLSLSLGRPNYLVEIHGPDILRRLAVKKYKNKKLRNRIEGFYRRTRDSLLLGWRRGPAPNTHDSSDAGRKGGGKKKATPAGVTMIHEISGSNGVFCRC